MFKKLLLLAFLSPCLAFANESSFINANVDNAEASVTSIPGGWSEYRALSRNEYNTFYQALGGLVGVSYFLLRFPQCNSRNELQFICNAQPTYPDAPTYAVVVEVYHPINGTPELVSINEIN